MQVSREEKEVQAPCGEIKYAYRLPVSIGLGLAIDFRKRDQQMNLKRGSTSIGPPSYFIFNSPYGIQSPLLDMLIHADLLVFWGGSLSLR
jgi:hypothetical protein